MNKLIETYICPACKKEYKGIATLPINDYRCISCMIKDKKGE